MKSLVCFISLALGATLFAQGDGATREVYLRLLAFDSRTVPETSFAFDPASPGAAAVEAPVKSYLNHQGTVMKLAGNEVIFAGSNKIEDAKNPDTLLAKVSLPKTGRAFILVFLPAGKDKFKVLPLSDAVKDFPLGSYRMVSLSRFPIRLTLEKKPYEFQPGQISLIENPPMAENSHSGMTCEANKDGKWQRIGSGSWPSLGEKRAVEIFFDNPTTGNTELRGFRDISPLASKLPEPEPATTPSP